MNGRYFLAVTFEKRISPSRLQTSEKFLKIKIKKFLKESYPSNVLLRDVAERGYVAALSSVALLLCPLIYFFWGTSRALGGGDPALGLAPAPVVGTGPQDGTQSIPWDGGSMRTERLFPRSS